ncbi:MAG: hypothetical protein AAFX40_05710, partial [Cyanobacteria bacterium J06639_1]
QHVVINWICRGLVDAIHLNNCCFKRKTFRYVLTPITGRRVIYSQDTIDDSGVQGIDHFISSLPLECPANLFYSLEDQSTVGEQVCKLDTVRSRLARSPITILVLRDPANWLASSFSHGRSSREFVMRKLGLFIEYLEKAVAAIHQPDPHLISVNYNQFISDRAYRTQLAEKLHVKDFENAEEALGMTVKFGKGSSFKGDRRSKSTLERWQIYRDDEVYRDTLKHARLRELSQQFFGELPGYKEMGLY